MSSTDKWMEWFDLPQLWCRWVQRSILEPPQISEPAAKTRSAELASCLWTLLPKTIYQTQQQLETSEITKTWLWQRYRGRRFCPVLWFTVENLGMKFWLKTSSGKMQLGFHVNCPKEAHDYVFSTKPADLSSQGCPLVLNHNSTSGTRQSQLSSEQAQDGWMFYNNFIDCTGCTICSL